MTILQTIDLTKKFGKFTALDQINLQVNEGEIYGFIGPNGAGKSTTIRTLLGMLKPTSGTAKIFGKDTWKDAVEIHKRIAYVPGDVNLWPNLTGGEVIDILLKMNGQVDKKRRDVFIDRFQLDPKKKCRSYSKGNRQKVALVAAFSRDADLYILDEPTSGLDPLMEHTFQECIKEVQANGKTVFLSSHILSEVEKVCDKVGIIRQGKIIETGTLTELRHLTRTKITVVTKEPITNLETISGVHQVTNHNQEWNFQVDTEKLGEVIRYLSSFSIVKFESMPPTLEDLFMRHYKETEQAGGAGHA
ncbi:MAG: ABC transporter ATP-binding protein [Caldibacillus thermoamylovorans]